jgi:hypothetical protein
MTSLIYRTGSTILITLTLCLPLLGSADSESPETPLEWLAGHWCSGTDGNTAEEFWLPPHGGVVLGLGRTLNAGRTTGFEYLRITEVEGAPHFIAQPGGRPPTRFRRTAGGEDWIRFENPEHDFPQRIEYRREGGALHAEVGGPGKDGDDMVIRFDYRPCDGM